ncbi:MAG: hypothetical protein CVT70_15185 [Alphaproteobacteria bacterium HGW-Alphaproteobacteria-1]|jgi:hypothetical protein|nr:MAG: hypothetical protein CVT70_15185 [Alphaproteobacteria bacterium HGW-Alphaproteobacteria-1]
MPETSLAALKDRAPGCLQEVWRRFGRFDWFGGGFQVVDPLRYAPLLDRLFAGAPHFIVA